MTFISAQTTTLLNDNPLASPKLTPAVSIGLPVYNGETYLERAIDSLLGQSFSDFELIICDNASVDRTAQICLGYASRDARVRYLRNARNLGAGPNFDMCFRHSRGEFFQWAAHDDMFAPTYLERAVAALRGQPDATLCTVGIVEIGANGAAIRTYDTPLHGMESADPVARFAAVIHTRHQCEDFFGLYRRSALIDSGLVGAFVGSDRVLLAEMAIRGPWVHLTEPLFLHREHAERATRAVLLVDRKRAALRQDPEVALRRKRSLFHIELFRSYWRLIARNVPANRGPYYRQLLLWWFTDEHFTDVVRDFLRDVSPRMLRWARAAKHALVGANRATPPGSLPTLKP
jgi:glycosyltransferase involved in cell wall biosynthesis